MTGLAAHLIQHHHPADFSPALGFAFAAALVWFLAARRGNGRGGGR